MTRSIRTAGLALAISGLLAAPTMAQVTLANVRVHAEVAGIDHPNRLVTLRGSQGSLTEHRVPDEMTGFEQLQIGDDVTAVFLHEIGIHLRRAGAPTPDLSRLTPPGGGASVVRTMEAEVWVIDPTVPAISFKSDSGEQATIRVPHGLSLSDFAEGDIIDVTYVIPEVVSVMNR